MNEANKPKELLKKIRDLDIWDKDFETKLKEIRKEISLKLEDFNSKDFLEYTYILKSKNINDNNKKATIKNIILFFDEKLSALENEKHNNEYGLTIHAPTSLALWQESKCINFFEFKLQNNETQQESINRIINIFRNLEIFKDSENKEINLKLANEFLKEKKTIKSKECFKQAIKNKSIVIVREYKNKLNQLVNDILTEYEKDGKDVFDSFEDIYTFVISWIEKNKTFHKANVGYAQHRLCSINKRKSTGEAFINNKEMLEYKDKKTQAILNVPKALGGKFYPATLRTFMILTKFHTESNSHIPEFSFTITEYMNICGLRDKKSATELLKRDLDIITTSTIDLKSKSTVGQMNMIDKWLATSETGRINVRFTKSYFDEIKYYPTGYISDSALKLDINKHPNSLHFEFKINQHKRSNFEKHNENIFIVFKFF